VALSVDYLLSINSSPVVNKWPINFLSTPSYNAHNIRLNPMTDGSYLPTDICFHEAQYGSSLTKFQISKRQLETGFY